jgi:hypothetical protein
MHILLSSLGLSNFLSVGLIVNIGKEKRSPSQLVLEGLAHLARRNHSRKLFHQSR